jgi:hypothetical protein
MKNQLGLAVYSVEFEFDRTHELELALQYVISNETAKRCKSARDFFYRDFRLCIVIENAVVGYHHPPHTPYGVGFSALFPKITLPSYLAHFLIRAKVPNFQNSFSFLENARESFAFVFVHSCRAIYLFKCFTHASTFNGNIAISA